MNRQISIDLFITLTLLLCLASLSLAGSAQVAAKPRGAKPADPSQSAPHQRVIPEAVKADVRALAVEARGLRTLEASHARWGPPAALDAGPLFISATYRRMIGSYPMMVTLTYGTQLEPTRTQGIIFVHIVIEWACSTLARQWAGAAIREWLGEPLEIKQYPPFGERWRYYKVLDRKTRQYLWTDTAGLQVEYLDISTHSRLDVCLNLFLHKGVPPQERTRHDPRIWWRTVDIGDHDATADGLRIGGHLVGSIPNASLGQSGTLHHVRGEDPGPPADPVQRRHVGRVDLEPDAPALGHDDHREPPADLHRAGEPHDAAVGRALSMTG